MRIKVRTIFITNTPYHMSILIGCILIVLWLIGFIFFRAVGRIIHIILVIAVILISVGIAIV